MRRVAVGTRSSHGGGAQPRAAEATAAPAQSVKRIALVTHAGLPELSADDRLLAAALRRRGAAPVATVWDTTSDWEDFDLVVLRSCWDYHLRAAEFLGWIERLERCRVRLENRPELVRWNADKTYLRDLEHRGTLVPPTVWIAAGETASVQGVMRSQGWAAAVVKPTIAASAFGVRRVRGDEPEVHVRGPMMVQELLAAVALSGEWSLVFIRGAYSHAVLKKPAAGDFRVQEELGGSTATASPGPRRVAQAAAVVAGLGPAPLYARVDAVDDPRGLVLMELELIEPSLFLAAGGAADRLAEAILEPGGPAGSRSR
jgi:hypothetical protein